MRLEVIYTKLFYLHLLVYFSIYEVIYLGKYII
jgi:hypothetical protein